MKKHEKEVRMANQARNLPSGKENGHHGFRVLGCDMFRSDLTRSERTSCRLEIVIETPFRDISVTDLQEYLAFRFKAIQDDLRAFEPGRAFNYYGENQISLVRLYVDKFDKNGLKRIVLHLVGDSVWNLSAVKLQNLIDEWSKEQE